MAGMCVKEEGKRAGAVGCTFQGVWRDIKKKGRKSDNRVERKVVRGRRQVGS
jgi:hypothetical protein